MPGNVTTERSPRMFLPAVWLAQNVTSGQGTGVAMNIAGLAIDALPLPRDFTLVSVGVVLSQAVTSGFIRLGITVNGSQVGPTFDMDSAQGTKALWEFTAGQLTASKGQEIGVEWGSNAGLAPSGVIDVHVFLEVQPY